MSIPSRGVPSDVKHPDKKMKARGLSVFIADIRSAPSREKEEQRVYNELAKVRAKFAGQTNKPLSSYDKKKYIFKVLYAYLLGYDVDFGHMQAIELMSSTIYSEKMCGYTAFTLLTKNTDELMTLVMNTFKKDLAPRMDEFVQCLALCAVANIGGRDLALTLADDVRRLLMDEASSMSVRKKAALTLLRLSRDAPDSVTLPTQLELAQVTYLRASCGMMLSGSALLRHMILVQDTKGDDDDDDQDDKDTMSEKEMTRLQRPQVQTLVVKTLAGLNLAQTCSADCYYHHSPAPWLQVSLVQVLLAMKSPPPAPEIADMLYTSLQVILKGVKWTKWSTTNNASRCVAFEAISLVVRYGSHVRVELVDAVLDLLERFLASKNANTRYLALSAMVDAAQAVLEASDGTVMVTTNPSSGSQEPELPPIGAAEAWWSALKSKENTVIASLRDPDASVRKRALDLLFFLCDQTSSNTVVNELLSYLKIASSDLDDVFKEEMVLKIAVLAERYAVDSKWYCDMVLRLIEVGGDHVGDDVWHRFSQIIVNHDDLQRYSALQMYRVLLSPSHVSESTVRVAAYVLGEFGYLLNTEYNALKAGVLDHEVTSIDLFGSIHRHFQLGTTVTKSIILNAYIKLWNIYEDLAEPVSEVFRQCAKSSDAELQQRACEYQQLANLNVEMMHSVLEPMPPWAEDRQSPLVKHLNKQKSNPLSAGTAGAAQDASTSPRLTMQQKHPVPANKVVMMESQPQRPQRQSLPQKQVKEEEQEQEQDDEEEPLVDTSSSTMPQSGMQSLLGTVNDEVPQAPPITELDIRKMFFNAILSPKALLYDDSKLQIGSQQEFHGARGRVSIFVGNLASYVFSSLKIEYQETQIPNTGSLKYTRTEEQTLPCDLLPGMQARVHFDFQCLVPFVGSPTIQVSWYDGLQPIILRLPCVVTSFCEPVTMTAMDFNQRWAALETRGGLQAVEALDDAPLKVAVAKTEKCMELLKLGRVSGWPLGGNTDPNSLDMALAATLRTVTINPRTNEPWSVGVLVRIECNGEARAARISVRAAHPSAAAAIQPVLVSQVLRLFKVEF